MQVQETHSKNLIESSAMLVLVDLLLNPISLPRKIVVLEMLINTICCLLPKFYSVSRRKNKQQSELWQCCLLSHWYSKINRRKNSTYSIANVLSKIAFQIFFMALTFSLAATYLPSLPTNNAFFDCISAQQKINK